MVNAEKWGAKPEKWERCQLAIIVTSCHNRDEFIGVCKSFIPKSVAIMQTDFVQCGLRDAVYNAANVCEPHFVTGKTVRLMKHLVTSFRQAMPASQLRRSLKIPAVFNHVSFSNARFE